MTKSENFATVLTSELLFKQESDVEQGNCKAELSRRLKSIGFTDAQVEQFIAVEQTVINQRRVDEYGEQLIGKKKFISESCPSTVEVETLTISELLLITREATNVYPRAKEGSFDYFRVVSDFAEQLNAEGYHEAVARLRAIGLTDESVKKFIFADIQVIRRVASHDEEAVDAWGKPEQYLS